MKVICIDNKDGIYKIASVLLVEGKDYNASQNKKHPNAYDIEGILYNPSNGKRLCFCKKRFIPLSEINELSIEYVNLKELV